MRQGSLIMLRANEQYFINSCIELLDDNLLYIVNTDSYIRQPCYSSRAIDCYYLIVENDKAMVLEKIKYIQGEFQEFVLNYLTSEEVLKYPPQGKWQFIFSKNIYKKNDLPILEATSDDHLQALRQALIGVGHIARHYYLRDLDTKTHTWAVRQFGWALKYAEFGILSLWNYIRYGKYSSSIEKYTKIKPELEWLLSTNKQWIQAERLMLADVQEYKQASLKLNKIQQYFSKTLRANVSKENYLQLDQVKSNNIDVGHIAEFKDDLIAKFKNNVRALYLIGSAARGDQNKDSDIDTIIVFSKLDEEVLIILSQIIQKYKKLSAYTLSMEDLIIYPEFRYYTLNEGSKKVFGDISFKETTQNLKVIDGTLNNMFIILQVARSYLLMSNYGHRSVHMLKLMMKLADHGCMRPFAKYSSGKFPDKQADVKSIFTGNKFSTEVIEFVQNVNNHSTEVQHSLLNGNQQPLIDAYTLLDNFVAEFREMQNNYNL